jgi:hypothetical protein
MVEKTKNDKVKGIIFISFASVVIIVGASLACCIIKDSKALIKSNIPNPNQKNKFDCPQNQSSHQGQSSSCDKQYLNDSKSDFTENNKSKINIDPYLMKNNKQDIINKSKECSINDLNISIPGQKVNINEIKKKKINNEIFCNNNVENILNLVTKLGLAFAAGMLLSDGAFIKMGII